jgi:hypothetical protein
MDKGNRAGLSAAEQRLIDQTTRASLAPLDEDALADLHLRVRRARDKQVGLYRRGASARVRDVGGRGKAHAQNQLAREKAEVFEGALARVSSALAKAARASANALKAERLEAARSSPSAPTSAPRPGASPSPREAPARTRSGSRRPEPSVRAKNADTRATGARRQAKRDGR